MQRKSNLKIYINITGRELLISTYLHHYREKKTSGRVQVPFRLTLGYICA